jgi:hypothetical protein
MANLKISERRFTAICEDVAADCQAICRSAGVDECEVRLWAAISERVSEHFGAGVDVYSHMPSAAAPGVKDYKQNLRRIMAGRREAPFDEAEIAGGCVAEALGGLKA